MNPIPNRSDRFAKNMKLVLSYRRFFRNKRKKENQNNSKSRKEKESISVAKNMQKKLGQKLKCLSMTVFKLFER
jgi:hypothetical protein